MVTYRVQDPSDRLNPLDAQLLTRNLIYHGTRSLFCESIEAHGLSSMRFRETYGPAIQRVVAACKRLNFFPNGYAAAQLPTSQDRAFLTAEYRTARAYSQNVGREAVYGAFRTAEAFLAFAADQERTGVEARKLEAALQQHGGRHAPTERVIADLRNSELVGRLFGEVNAALTVLKSASSPSNPVVYAAEADEFWAATLEEGQDPHARRESMGGIAFDSVPADLIVARVDFSNGIAPGSE